MVVSFASSCSAPSRLLTDNNVTGCGNWSAWSDWSTCPDSCDSRSRNRTRTCDDGNCGVDPAIEFETCPTSDCSGTRLFTYIITSTGVLSMGVELPPVVGVLARTRSPSRSFPFYPDTVHFHWYISNFNKITLPFSNIICQFLLICFKVRISKISDKPDAILLNYSSVFWGPLFFRTQCIVLCSVLCFSLLRFYRVFFIIIFFSLFPVMLYYSTHKRFTYLLYCSYKKCQHFLSYALANFQNSVWFVFYCTFYLLFSEKKSIDQSYLELVTIKIILIVNFLKLTIN